MLLFNMDFEKEEMKRYIEQLEGEKEELQNEIRGLEDDIERLNDALKVSEEEYEELLYDYALLEYDYRTELTVNDNLINRTEDDDEYKITRMELRMELEELQDEYNDLMNENNILESEIRKQEGYYQTLLDKVDDLESYNAELEAENDRLRTAYEKELNKPTENTDALHASIDILTKEKASLKESNRKLINMIDDLREENIKLKDHIIKMIIK